MTAGAAAITNNAGGVTTFLDSSTAGTHGDPFSISRVAANRFGFRASYLWQVGNVFVEPTLQAAWEHEYKYSDLPVTAGFAGIPGPADTFYGPSEGEDSAIVSAGVSA